MSNALLDLVRYLLHYLPVILLALPVIVWAYRELKTQRQWQIAMGLATVIGAIMAAAFLATGIPQATHHDWSACRLAPTVAWLGGYQLYYPEGQGPVLVQMYGPVSAMLYIPVVMAAHPTSAVIIGAAINSILYILPAAIFLLWSRRSQAGVFIAAAVAGFLLVSSRQFVLWEAATHVTIDAPAAGFAACAFAVLARERWQKLIRTGVICGLFAALSMWTKLTFAPIVIAMVVYVWLAAGTRSAAQFTAALLIAVAGISGFFVVCFGPELLFQNIIVPARQPWQWPWLDWQDAYLRAIRFMWPYSRPTVWIVLIAVLIRPELPRFKRDEVRFWTRQNPWLLPFFGSLCVLPTATLAIVKVGGSWNNAVASLYFALLAAMGALSTASGSEDVKPRLPAMNRIARLSLATLLLAFCWLNAEARSGLRSGLLGWMDLGNNDQETAFRFIREHAEEVYFPSYPLAQLLAENRLYHFQAGVESMEWAGFPLSQEHWRAGLPPRMRAIVYKTARPPVNTLRQLAEFDKQISSSEMPGWTIATRDGAGTR